MINDFVEKIEDTCRLAQTCIDLHRLAKTYMTIGKTGTVIFDVEMVGVGLVGEFYWFYWEKGDNNNNNDTQQIPRSLRLRCAGLKT